MDGMAEELERYFVRLEEEGQKLPGIKRTGKPHFGAISIASGIDYKFLTSEPARRLISVAAEALGVERLPRLRGEKLLKQNSSLVANYLRWLGERGLTLPEDPRHKREIFFRQAEIESGLAPNTLVLKKPEASDSDVARLRVMLQDSVLRLRLGVRILLQSPGDDVALITYERLLERGTEERRSELKGRRSADPQ